MNNLDGQTCVDRIPGRKPVPIELFRLTDANGMEMIINPAMVRYLTAGPHGTTRVCFDNAHTVSVRGPPREIQNRLTGGTGDMEVWAPPASGS
jgi:hypothetical protein